MFSVIQSSRASFVRGFSTSRPMAQDLAKVTLIGRLVKEPETRLTKNEKEYCLYTVATSNPRGPPNADGERPPTASSFHKIMSFNEGSNKFLRTLTKGTKVYVEAGYEIREPEADADPSTYQGQRQIFLRHETLRVVSQPVNKTESTDSPKLAEHSFDAGF